MWVGRGLFSADLVLSDVEDFLCRKGHRDFRGEFVKKQGERKESKLRIFSVASSALDSFPPSPDFLHQRYSLPAAPERCRSALRQQHGSVLAQNVTISQLLSPMSLLRVPLHS